MIGGHLGVMMARHGSKGRVTGLFIRSERRATVSTVEAVHVALDGLDGDHARAGKRAVTLIQAEHLPVISAFLGGVTVAAADLRRNILVTGINLLALRKTHVRIGECVLFVHGPCPPCSRMEEVFGHGGYSAVRGHGGVYAEVIEPGLITLSTSVVRRGDD